MKLKRAGLLTRVLVMVLFVYAAATLISLHSKIETAEAETESLRQAVEDVAAQNDELKYYIANSDDDEVKEDIARDHDYIKQGEQVYKTGE